jgi:HNH endonuclease
MRIPKKPFENYKWRWAEFTPSEGLNNPLRIMGILRALYEHQGQRYSVSDVYGKFASIERDTNKSLETTVSLVRDGARNLFRNSGRYWKALGLISNKVTIDLTELGKQLATGALTENEFALATLNDFTLPNPFIENTDTLETWNQAGLSIKPLRLIATLLLDLYSQYGSTQAYLTAEELQMLIIPLAGDDGTPTEYLKAVLLYRNGQLDASTFPDCTPGSNDKRMAREFLLFFQNYGFCEVQNVGRNKTHRFLLLAFRVDELRELLQYNPTDTSIKELIRVIRKNPVILTAERKRTQTYRTDRPGQAAFRKAVINHSQSTCLLTGERIPVVLEAAHIIPVEYKGADVVENGLCLREDIHTLFDGRHIRIEPTGKLHYSDMLLQGISYTTLPAQVQLPDYISEEAINWRWQYY